MSTPLLRNGPARLSPAVWASGHAIWDHDTNGRTYRADQLEVANELPPQYVARALGLCPGENACVRRRRYVVEDRPVQLATTYLPAKIVQGSAITLPDTGPGGVYARLAELGQAPAHFSEDLRVRTPAPAEQANLELDDGIPIIEIVRIAFTNELVPVEVANMTLAANAYILRYEFHAD